MKPSRQVALAGLIDALGCALGPRQFEAYFAAAYGKATDDHVETIHGIPAVKHWLACGGTY